MAADDVGTPSLRVTDHRPGRGTQCERGRSATSAGAVEPPGRYREGRDRRGSPKRRGADVPGRISESEPVRRAYAQVELVAPTPSTVLLLGETGSGKEVFAQAIHDLSPRHRRPMISVNCAAIPSALIESELSGVNKAPTQARSRKQIGRFEPPTGPRCSSTRSESCPRRCKSSCSGSSRNG